MLDGYITALKLLKKQAHILTEQLFFFIYDHVLIFLTKVIYLECARILDYFYIDNTIHFPGLLDVLSVCTDSQTR